MKIRKFFDDFKLDVSVNYVLKVEYQTIEGDLETKNGRMNLSDEEREDIRLDIQDLKMGALSKERIERLGSRLYRLLFPGEIASELGIAIERVNRGLRPQSRAAGGDFVSRKIRDRGMAS